MPAERRQHRQAEAAAEARSPASQPPPDGLPERFRAISRGQAKPAARASRAIGTELSQSVRSGTECARPVTIKLLRSGPTAANLMAMARILDLEQALLLLELEAPFDKRQVQLARRRMAKRWHPDIAPPGRQHEHQRHLQAINEAADELERLAETSRGGTVSRNAVKVSAAAARKAREEEGRRAYEAEQRAREQAADRAKYDPFGSRVPDHSVVHRYARCLSYPEWGVGTVSGIYFSGEGDDVQQWARMSFQVGVRTVPGRLAAVRRLLQARPGRRARRALHDRRPARAGRGRPRARRAAPDLRARRRPQQPGGAAAADRRLLAVRQPAGRRPRRARLGPGRDRPSHRRALRLADLRGHGRDRPGHRRRAARHRARARGRLGLGAARAPAAAADGPRGARSRRWSARAGSSRRSRSCSTWRSPTTWPATSAPRSRRPRRRR